MHDSIVCFFPRSRMAPMSLDHKWNLSLVHNPLDCANKTQCHNHSFGVLSPDVWYEWDTNHKYCWYVLISKWSCDCFQNPYIRSTGLTTRRTNTVSMFTLIGQSTLATPIIWRSLFFFASGLPTIGAILTFKPTFSNRFGQRIVFHRVRADIHLVQPTFQFPWHALSCLHLPILDIDTLNNFELP